MEKKPTEKETPDSNKPGKPIEIPSLEKVAGGVRKRNTLVGRPLVRGRR